MQEEQMGQQQYDRSRANAPQANTKNTDAEYIDFEEVK